MPASIPLPSPDFVGPLATTLDQADSLESLVRPLLELLQAVTGLEATYFTRIDSQAGQQQVLYAHNSGQGLVMPEALVVPWDDTLCRRALQSSQCWTAQVAELWGDSQAARELGIGTYTSTPVVGPAGELIGTLCGASAGQVLAMEGAERLLAMFAQLIGQYIARENLLTQLQLAHQALRESADTDALTGLPNRRALLQEIDRRLDRHAQAGTELVVCFIDLDGFKAINDCHGHLAGDRFLAAVGERLRRGQRPEDYCARLGGDEFVTLTSLGHVPEQDIELQLRQRLTQATSGRYDLGDGVVVDYSGASIGMTRANGETHAIALLARADAAMYRDKQQRRAAPPQPAG